MTQEKEPPAWDIPKVKENEEKKKEDAYNVNQIISSLYAKVLFAMTMETQLTRVAVSIASSAKHSTYIC